MFKVEELLEDILGFVKKFLKTFGAIIARSRHVLAESRDISSTRYVESRVFLALTIIIFLALSRSDVAQTEYNAAKHITGFSDALLDTPILELAFLMIPSLLLILVSIDLIVFVLRLRGSEGLQFKRFLTYWAGAVLLLKTARYFLLLAIYELLPYVAIDFAPAPSLSEILDYAIVYLTRCIIFTIPAVVIFKYFQTRHVRLRFLLIPALVLGFSYFGGAWIFRQVKYLYESDFVQIKKTETVTIVGSTMKEFGYCKLSFKYDSINTSGNTEIELTGKLMVQNSYKMPVYCHPSITLELEGRSIDLAVDSVRDFLEIAPGALATYDIKTKKPTRELLYFLGENWHGGYFSEFCAVIIAYYPGDDILAQHAVRLDSCNVILNPKR